MSKQKKKTEEISENQTLDEVADQTDADAPVKEGNKRGAPSQYAKKVKPFLDDIGRYVSLGVTEGQICAYYGVGKTQWAAYKKQFPELTETLFKARERLKYDLLDKAYKIAMGYDYEEETTVTYKDADGNVTGTKTTHHKKHARADAGLVQFLLINRFPDDFARDPQMLELRKQAIELAKQGKIDPDKLEGV